MLLKNLDVHLSRINNILNFKSKLNVLLKKSIGKTDRSGKYAEGY